MVLHAFHPHQILPHIWGTQPFHEYCERRSLLFKQQSGYPITGEDYLRWEAALETLTNAQRMRVEWDLVQVSEMADRTPLALLIDATHERGPLPDPLPDAALALWFLLHHPDLFQEAFLHQEASEADAWRTAHAPPGITLSDLKSQQDALAASLQGILCLQGTARFCAVHAYPLEDAYCFVASLSDRPRRFDVFTEEGVRATQVKHPVFVLVFAYYPDDGRIILKTRERAADKILDLFQRFAQVVLGVELDEHALAPGFRLDLFKRRFDPPRDADDMEMVRVKALHLVYPERWGRRRLKLETLPGDAQFAILDLLQQHGGSDEVLEQLRVLHVELQVKLRVEGHSKSYLVRLWPDRCSVNQPVLGQRLRDCLTRWGIPYGS